ncbi:MAG: glycyl-radical enzyme activating protein [Bacteroidales bacterium]|nr:glycyl-radical enzyme activating protein [Bacteroidales bacterium]
MEGIIFNIQHYSIHDGPGIRTSVFFKGCPMNCWWCHNPESQNPLIEEFYKSNSTAKVKEKQIIGKKTTVDELYNEIIKDRIFYNESGGGVTFTGGEPLMQSEFLISILKKCKENGIHTALDTSGFSSENIFNSIIDLVDLFLYDIKFIDEYLHKKYTGVSNKQIIKNLKILSESKKEVFIRIPIIPKITETKENIKQIIDFLKEINILKNICLLAYHKISESKYERFNMNYKLKGIKPPSKERLNEIREYFSKAGFNVTIGG